MSGTVKTPPKFAATLSSDPAVREIQQYLLAQNQSVLNNPILAAADWRWAQEGSTFALQFRTPPQDWNTVASFNSSGTLSTDATGGAATGYVPLSAFTTAGDLVVGTGASAVTRLASGAVGTVLAGNGAGVAPSYRNAATLTAVGGGVFPVPSTADSRDDEFTGTTFGSWTTGGGEVATAVDEQAAFTTAGQYRYDLSSRRNSWWLLQASNNATSISALAKTVTFVAGDVFYARVGVFSKALVNADMRLLFQFTDGTFNETIRLEANLNDATPNLQVRWGYVTGGVLTDTGIAYAAPVSAYPIEYVAIQRVGNDWHYWIAGSNGAWRWLGTYTKTVTITTMVVTIRNLSSTNPGCPIVAMDYIRFNNSGHLP